MLDALEYQRAVEIAFAWLLDRGFRAAVTSYGFQGHSAVLTNERNWLRLSWEARDEAILMTWGEYLPAGYFNDDALRNPKMLSELMPLANAADIEAAGRFGGDELDGVRAALQRLSSLVQAYGWLRLLGEQ